MYNSVGWSCLAKVSCDSTNYFHGLTSTSFLPSSLTTRSRYPAEDTGIVKQGFVALDSTGKFQVSLRTRIHIFIGFSGYGSFYLLAH